MARNDSSQVAQLLQHNYQDESVPLCKSYYYQKHGLARPSPEPPHSPYPPPEEPIKPPPALEDSPPPASCALGDLRRISCAELEPLDFSPTHTVLVDVHVFNRDGGLVAQRGKDTWASHCVKLPCSPKSVIHTSSGTKQSRWSMISKRLKKLAEKKPVSVHDVEKAIVKYNPKYKGQWSFEALKAFGEVAMKERDGMSALFQKIAALALKLDQYVMKGIPLLQSGRAASITLSQVQISCLLANAFFCTFPHRNTTRSSSEYHSYPTINFTSLFGDRSERKMEKLKAIMHYFRVVTDDKTKLDGLVTFERRCLADTNVHIWKRCKEKMDKLYVSSRGTIESEGTGMLQVDFANSWVGGGVLSSGLLQEEILFLLNPELIVSRLFTERLQDNECLVVTGCQQFSSYSGFRDTFKWGGPHHDCTGRDRWARRQRQILAIDALHFKHEWDQYNMRMVTRELNKAYSGFEAHGGVPDIATGKWGCGAFSGDPQLKALIQLMAAAKAKRGMAFFTFGDEKLEQCLKQTYGLLRAEGTTVEQLFDLLADFCAVQVASGPVKVELFEYIKTHLPSSRNLSKSLL